MKKIIVEHFRSLDNYGTGMMGLVAVQAIADRLGAENVEFHCDFESDEALGDAQGELCAGVRLVRYQPKWSGTVGLKSRWLRRLMRLWYLLFSVEGRGYDMIIVLGGDDFSEYYGRNDAAMALFRKWKSSFVSQVVLFGQTVGPFTSAANKFAVRRFLPRMKLYCREQASADYLLNNFNTKAKVAADLALSDLPLQSNEDIVRKTMLAYGLSKKEYFSIVVSAGQLGGRYYTRKEEDYIGGFRKTIEMLAADPRLSGKKVVLLAHTFGRYGDEARYLRLLRDSLPAHLQLKTVLIEEKILPTRARAILSRGLFTVTGRMHAAVSTFQMGTPAICLSYSTKFSGVIGQSIGCPELVIEADDDELWTSRKIALMIVERAEYLLENHTILSAKISTKVASERLLLENALDEITEAI